MAKQREWEITMLKDGQLGTFRFGALDKELAHDHAMTLLGDPAFTAKHGIPQVSPNVNERMRGIAVRCVGWTEA